MRSKGLNGKAGDRFLCISVEQPVEIGLHSRLRRVEAVALQFGLRAALPAQRKYADCDRTAQHTGKQTEEEFSPSAGRFPCHLFGRLFWCQNLHNRLNRLRLRGRRPTAAAETCFRLQFTAA